MSKMFEALRKAEEERMKRQSEQTNEPERPPGGSRAKGPIDFESRLDKKETMFRELGILRNSIESALSGREKRAIIFSSSASGEGATTLAVNFAKLLAMHGKEKVLLCEMNARRPSFNEIFGLKSGGGLIEFFSGRETLRSIVQSIPNIGLHVAVIGNADPSIFQLHLPTLFPKLLQSAHAEFTTVIIDAPPIARSSETPTMSSLVDGIVLVVRAGKTKREVVRRSIKAVEELNGRILGVVLNRKKYYIPEFLYKRV